MMRRKVRRNVAASNSLFLALKDLELVGVGMDEFTSEISHHVGAAPWWLGRIQKRSTSAHT